MGLRDSTDARTQHEPNKSRGATRVACRRGNRNRVPDRPAHHRGSGWGSVTLRGVELRVPVAAEIHLRRQGYVRNTEVTHFGEVEDAGIQLSGQQTGDERLLGKDL